MIVLLTDNQSLNAWGELIGFNENPKSILPVPETMCRKARKFDGCSFTTLDGSKLPEFIINTYGNLYDDVDNDTLLPVYFVPNFDSILARYHASIVL